MIGTVSLWTNWFNLLVFSPAVISTITAGEELLVSVEVDILLRQSHCGVLHILGVVPVNRVNAGDGHILFTITEIFDGTELPGWFELIIHMDPPIEIEKVYF